MMPPTVPLEQVMAQARQIEALQADVESFRIAHDRADGALADAATVPTGDLERGIRALTAERNILADALRYSDEKWARSERQVRAYRDTVVLAGPVKWWAVEDSDPVEMPQPENLAAILDDLAGLTADVKALAEALEAVAHHTDKGFTFCALCNFVSEAGHNIGCLVGAALARDGVRRRREKG